MQFSFTEDQRLLRDGVRDFLADQCKTEHVARAWTERRDDTRWKALAGLGVVGLLAPESVGGLGMDEVDLVLVLEEAGWAGLPEPLVEVAAVAVPLLATAGRDDLLAEVVSGDRLVLPALRVDPFPGHLGAGVDVLVESDDGLALVGWDDLDHAPVQNVDHARPTSAVPSSRRGEALAVEAGDIADAAARGAWATGAVLCGAARRTIDLAVEYALQREQFGRPIGSFQAVKHHLADALVAVEFARPAVHRAAFSLATGDGAASLHASMAKAVAAEAAEAAAKASLQVHGAIGYTWEHPLHLFMKRIWSLSAAWGTTEHHWQAIEGGALP